MKDLDLSFPVFDDALMPPPKLTLAQYQQRICQYWASLTPGQRAEQLRRDEENRITVPFRIPDDAQDPRTRRA